MSGFKRAGSPAEDPLKWKQSRNDQSGMLGAPRPACHPEQPSLVPAGQPGVEPSLITLPSFSDTVF